MQGIRQISFWVVLISVWFATLSAAAQTTLPITEDQLLYEFIGEYANSPMVTGPNNLQFGLVWISIQHHGAEFCIQRHAEK